MRSRTTSVASLILMLALSILPSAAAAQQLGAAALQRALRGCNGAHGDPASCRAAGGHYLLLLGHDNGQRGLALMRQACTAGDGQGCRVAAMTLLDGSPNHQISPDPDWARTLALRGCEIGDMPSCYVAERGGFNPPAAWTVDLLAQMHGTFDRTTTIESLRQQCPSVHGHLDEGQRPDHTLWTRCSAHGYLGGHVGGSLEVTLSRLGATTTQVQVTASVGATAPGVPSAVFDAVRRVGADLRARLLAAYQPRYALQRDPASPSYSEQYNPQRPNGVSASAGQDNFTINYDPRVP